MARRHDTRMPFIIGQMALVRGGGGEGVAHIREPLYGDLARYQSAYTLDVCSSSKH